MIRIVEKTFLAHRAPVGDFTVLRALPHAACRHVGPFVFLDHFGPIVVKEGPGIPAHPHAGIEVITYLFQGSQVHRDSMGNENRVGAGGAQWITAGRGILHAEKPDVGDTIHGVQIWTSLPRAMKRIDPRYHGVQAETIPQLDFDDATVRVIAGTFHGAVGPVILAQPALLLHVKVSTAFRVETQPAYHMGVYHFTGKIEIFSSGNAIELAAGEYIVLGGEPAEEPLLFGGPFVLDSPEALQQAQQDYFAGRMGTLDGVPH